YHLSRGKSIMNPNWRSVGLVADHVDCFDVALRIHIMTGLHGAHDRPRIARKALIDSQSA
ncbi:jg26558, partial [Pararge aegeria aegeria]